MIIHLDADAFFASVEQASDPRLRGRPVAVGGSKRGVVASASYEARKLGIYTTMPTTQARKICPNLLLLPGDFEKYERFSRLMFSYAYDHTPLVELASIDEGYFDLGERNEESFSEVAWTILNAIKSSLKISVSVGIGANKLVSAIASKLNKPSAFRKILRGKEQEFLDPLENKWLPGVGPKLATVLNNAGLTHIGMIARASRHRLARCVGSQSLLLRELACGIDMRAVIPEPSDAKSYSVQETFEADIFDEEWIGAKLKNMADTLLSKVRSDGKAVRTVEVRLRHHDFEEFRRSESLEEPTDLESEVYPVLYRLQRKAWERRGSIRLVGVKLSGIYDGIFQSRLSFANSTRDLEQKRFLSKIVDGLKMKHGSNACMRGHDLYLQEYGKKE